MSLVATNNERAAECIEALLVLASRKNLRINRTKVAKLLYLADLRSVDQSGTAGSGIAWRWLNHGPFDNVLSSIEDGLVRQRIVERETTRWGTVEREQGARPQGRSRIVIPCGCVRCFCRTY